MVDILALALSHGLLLLAAWRLVWRTDLDVETRGEASERAGLGANRRGRVVMKTGRRPEDEPVGGDD
ncbi:hypothetical protein [Novosphingobium sp. BL-52-GroH]|uniref:hypothetical protein n=1 Tax=Novosphingobium sp. BL-52-GroH TaxID=3349877 RepID=UPI0038509E1E